MMRFEDMPNYEELSRMCNEYYTYDALSTSRVYLFHKHSSNRYLHAFTTHRNMRHAYDYLRENQEIEVLDDFFGNNFPFIRSKITPVIYLDDNTLDPSEMDGQDIYRSDSKIMVRDLKILNQISNEDLEKDNDSKLVSPPCKFFAMKRHYSFYVNNYGELVDRLTVSLVMNL